MEGLVGDALVLPGRHLPFSGLDKIFNWQSGLKQAESSFLPDGPLLLVLAMFVEFVTPVCIMAAWFRPVCGLRPRGLLRHHGYSLSRLLEIPALLVTRQRRLPARLGLSEQLRAGRRAAADCSRKRPASGLEAAVRDIGGSDVHIGSGLARTGAIDRLSPVQSDR